MSKTLKILIFLFPIALFGIFVFLKVAHPATYLALIQEDSVLEYAQAFFYFVAFALAFGLAVQSFKNQWKFLGVWHGVLALGLLFVCLEEISWGQRIFHFQNGEFFAQHNLQYEVSLHNLDGVHRLLPKAYLLLGCYGVFGWLLRRLSFLKSKPNVARFVVPDWFFGSYFVFVFALYGAFSFFRPLAMKYLVPRNQEPAELLLSLGFLGFLATNFAQLSQRKQKSTINGKASAERNAPSRVAIQPRISH